MDPIYVFGHKNPDTDSICSAIAYAHLKNRTTPGHIPARLGELNLETRFVLDTFGVEQPEFLPHIYTRVADIMTRDPITATASTTIHEVGEMIHRHRIANVPVIDDDGRALGLVTERALAWNYLRELQIRGLQDTPAELGKIAQTLNGRLLVGKPESTVSGRVIIGAMDVPSMEKHIRPGDLVAVGNRENAQEAALRHDIDCLIVTGDYPPTLSIISLARETKTGLIVTPYDTFAAARLINLSASVVHTVEKEMLTVTPETLVADIREDLVESPAGISLVNDHDGRLVGVLTKSDLVQPRRRRVILVDHSERGQTIDGIEQADIIEILDHHRLGSLQTSEPMEALIAPVGCTSTLVLRRYQQAGVTPPPEMAGLMLSAILSDTMLLKSPTTTAEDQKAVEMLGELADQDPLAYGKRLFEAKFNAEALTPDQLITYDYKFFVLGDKRIGIGQIEVVDKDLVLARKEELLEAMKRHRESQQLDLMMLMVSDILLEGSALLVSGSKRLVEKAFDVSLDQGATFLPGVLSRKKQIVPPLARVI